MTKELKQIFDFLQEHEAIMRPGQISFIASLKKSYARQRVLTDPQLAVLYEIRRHVGELSENEAQQITANDSITVK